MNNLEWMETYMQDTQTDYIDCWCNDFEHVMRFNMMPDGSKEDPSVLFWIEGKLINNKSFWERIKYAWKYIWNSADGESFSSTEFSMKQVKQIKSLCLQYEDVYKQLQKETCEPMVMNPAFDFLKDEPDLYTKEDGIPIFD